MDVVMTIAGSDSGGGAGIQADLKTFQELKAFGTSVITALTAQNTMGVDGIFPTTPDFVAQQMNSVFQDFDVKALKTGMLFSAEIIETVAAILKEQDFQIVIDPVMIAKGGASLLQQEAVVALNTKLLPLATVLTPNIPEAEVISGVAIRKEEDIEIAAKIILEKGVQCVVMKGGHLEDLQQATDTVFFSDGTSFKMQSKRIQTKHTHGTGCTFSAAITAFLGKGYSLQEAIIAAKHFVQRAIAHPLNLGHGHGPTNHFAYQEHKETDEVLVYES
ncbi:MULTISPECIES: bifunctional hydroxymethylpyrimidine kinase/phosphomethylpyrimidine kinase [Lysinibacillus]|uniref:Hydroxymethylpyrimidine/phosphomethylpyrimidine kinase n=1 Tax=Lysinibacillus antri TaxID=2498145 RepID=A0A432LBT0_9BACI|nr:MULTISPECIES: bifunctional hydroxymethylpyrimidine kinase/phosphomethylpyrimidine kinase [Lysinibacillus]RUL52220.1 bifunctional hydroxymethylpyrimidine kinase/phosphomethylpyrimidine kinase [Lysinibacillus antri]TSI05205.1 bifunctional hydroxymethylpyrimidine kinase/phosphomethylpyrimidine kinase [Lysinibacillus sp. BW-2-10]